MIDIEKNYKEVINELNKVNRKGLAELIGTLIDKEFFNAPCSGGNHLACEGGLAEHSLNVLHSMRELNEAWNMELDEESIILCALLHDVGKCGDYGKPNYVPNILKSGKVSETKPFETNKELLYIPHEVRSIQIAERCIFLTEEEEHAIYYHNGKYTHIGYDLKETPLLMCLHFSDLFVSRVVEE